MKNSIYCLIISVIIFSCNTQDDYITDVYVNEFIDLDLHSELVSSGSSIFIEGGVEGIIIYHGVGSDYKVYDRNCSYEPSLACSVIDSINSGFAYCKCCPSIFDLNNSGGPIRTPALLPLKSYNWSLDNNILKISN